MASRRPSGVSCSPRPPKEVPHSIGCRTYWRPVYVYIRATGVERSEAEDATQYFFADMLQRERLKRADRERGSFRGFLRSSVRLLLSNRRRDAHTLKRGGKEGPVPLATGEAERELAGHADAGIDPVAFYEIPRTASALDNWVAGTLFQSF